MNEQRPRDTLTTWQPRITQADRDKARAGWLMAYGDNRESWLAEAETLCAWARVGQEAAARFVELRKKMAIHAVDDTNGYTGIG